MSTDVERFTGVASLRGTPDDPDAVATNTTAMVLNPVATRTGTRRLLTAGLERLGLEASSHGGTLPVPSSCDQKGARRRSRHVVPEDRTRRVRGPWK